MTTEGFLDSFTLDLLIFHRCVKEFCAALLPLTGRFITFPTDAAPHVKRRFFELAGLKFTNVNEHL